MTPARRTAYRTGRRAEWLCAWWLRIKGYRVLARNFRSPSGEIDLVARRGRILAFIEVKARTTAQDAADAARPRQRRRISRAAAHFLALHPALAQCDSRFDVMLVTPGQFPQHIVHAWDDFG